MSESIIRIFYKKDEVLNLTLSQARGLLGSLTRALTERSLGSQSDLFSIQIEDGRHIFDEPRLPFTVRDVMTTENTKDLVSHEHNPRSL